jgi:spermidine synthase
MRADNSRRLALKTSKTRLSDAFILGFGSIATQTVYIKLILSSEAGGELYAAIAIGGWIASVAAGAFLGKGIKRDRRAAIWLVSAAVKIPLAFLVFIYPSFFTGILDPLRFLPLVILGIAPTGILYGLLFPLLISERSKTSTVYRNEAAGSVVGGLLTVLFSYFGVGGFSLLFLLSGIEISRAVYGRIMTYVVPSACLIGGFILGPILDRAGLDIRWPGFETVKTTHGFSGLWAVHHRENQFTISHNGRHLLTIPDRQSSEEALLWPFLFHPEAEELLLVGFEGIETDKYLPENVNATTLIGDEGFLRLNVSGPSEYEISDPLSYAPDARYDIVNVYLKGGAGLGDNRFETDFFFEKCKNLLHSDGVLYVSAVSDENYISPELCRYLSAIKTTLNSYFESVSIIPGPRIGFVCRSADNGLSPVESLKKLKIDSPYFNEPLIGNRLASFRIAYLRSCFEGYGESNKIFKPASMINYLRWIGSMFGGARYFFQIYMSPYPLLLFPAILLIPFIIRIVGKSDFVPVLTVTMLGAAGLTSEITIIYLFQILFGYLYLHIGLIIAIFMGGMALGAQLGGKLKYYFIAGPFLIVVILFLFVPSIIESESGVKAALLLLYILGAVSGFCSGGGFAAVSERRPDGQSIGATLYGTDLYGAMAAAVLAPGLLIAFGVEFIFWSLFVIGLIISATLWYLQR